MTATLEVELGARSYPIHIGEDLSSEIALFRSRLDSGKRRYAVITDENVAEAQAAFASRAFGFDTPVCVLPAGEATKSFQQLEKICDFLAEHKFDRGACIFAFGGGVIGDLGGFAAACYLRGVDFVQVPTSLLAMVDSSVGGKTGINLKAGKNLVGAFHQPQAVFISTGVLKSLPAREFSSGMAEVIKHGMLADADLFSRLEMLDRLHPEHPQMGDIIKVNCSIKAGVVKADETERAASGGRALLNLGHTFGHAIEAVTGYGDYLHGEAIGAGLVLAARLSEDLGYISKEETERVRQLVKRYDLPVQLKQPLAMEALFEAMHRDKKVKEGRMRFVVVERIGKAATLDNITAEGVQKLWLEAGAKED